MTTSEASTIVFSGSLLPFNMLNNARFDGSLTFPNVAIETQNGALGWQQVKQCILTKVY